MALGRTLLYLLIGISSETLFACYCHRALSVKTTTIFYTRTFLWQYVLRLIHCSPHYLLRNLCSVYEVSLDFVLIPNKYCNIGANNMMHICVHWFTPMHTYETSQCWSVEVPNFFDQADRTTALTTVWGVGGCMCVCGKVVLLCAPLPFQSNSDNCLRGILTSFSLPTSQGMENTLMSTGLVWSTSGRDNSSKWNTRKTIENKIQTVLNSFFFFSGPVPNGPWPRGWGPLG